MSNPNETRDRLKVWLAEHEEVGLMGIGVATPDENFEEGESTQGDHREVTGQDAGVVFRFSVAEVANNFPDPFEFVPAVKRYASALVVAALVEELETSSEGERHQLSSDQHAALVVSASILEDRIDVLAIEEGSLVAVVLATLPALLHWLATLESVVTAVAYAPKLVGLAKRLVGRLRTSSKDWAPTLPPWIKDLPAGSKVTIDSRNQIVRVQIGEVPPSRRQPRHYKI